METCARDFNCAKIVGLVRTKEEKSRQCMRGHGSNCYFAGDLPSNEAAPLGESYSALFIVHLKLLICLNG